MVCVWGTMYPIPLGVPPDCRIYVDNGLFAYDIRHTDPLQTLTPAHEEPGNFEKIFFENLFKFGGP